MEARKPAQEALAFFTLFKSMRQEIKDQVKDLILKDSEDGDFTSEMLTSVSLESFKEIWEAPENNHWDKFIKDRLSCTNREIL
ncbi:hypothetical protein [Arcticibacter tournemirensis]